jgi:hypothetical protein
MHSVESKTPPLELEDYLLDDDYEEDYDGSGLGEEETTTDDYDEDEDDESTENEDNDAGVFRRKPVVVDEDVESQVDEDLEFGDEDDLPLTTGSPQSGSLAHFPPINNNATATTASAGPEAYNDPAMSRLQLSFEEATLEDYEDMDGLLDMLDKYLNRNSKAGLQGSPNRQKITLERQTVEEDPSMSLMDFYEVPLAVSEASRVEPSSHHVNSSSLKLPPPPSSLPPSKVTTQQERSVAYPPPSATAASPVSAIPSTSVKSSKKESKKSRVPPNALGSLPPNFTLPDGSDTDSEEGEVPAPRSSSNKSSPLVVVASSSSQVYYSMCILNTCNSLMMLF